MFQLVPDSKAWTHWFLVHISRISQKLKSLKHSSALNVSFAQAAPDPNDGETSEIKRWKFNDLVWLHSKIFPYPTFGYLKSVWDCLHDLSAFKSMRHGQEERELAGDICQWFGPSEVEANLLVASIYGLVFDNLCADKKSFKIEYSQSILARWLWLLMGPWMATYRQFAKKLIQKSCQNQPK